MRKNLSVATTITFAELAWIFVFGIMYLYLETQITTNPTTPNTSVAIQIDFGNWQDKLKQIDSHINSMVEKFNDLFGDSIPIVDDFVYPSTIAEADKQLFIINHINHLIQKIEKIEIKITYFLQKFDKVEIIEKLHTIDENLTKLLDLVNIKINKITNEDTVPIVDDDFSFPEDMREEEKIDYTLKQIIISIESLKNNDDLVEQKNNSQKEIMKYESENENLKKELEYFKSKIIELENRVKNLTEDKDNIKKEIEILKEKIKSLENKIIEQKEKIEKLEQENNFLKNENKEKKKENSFLLEETGVLKTDIDRLSNLLVQKTKSLGNIEDWQIQSSIHGELLGLKGNLDKVAIIIDISSSMTQAGRWKTAKHILETWLTNLAIKECVIIFFNENCDKYPKEKEFYDFYSKLEIDRELSVGILYKIKPVGNTNTYHALLKAYDCKVNTIILFTDGKPNTNFDINGNVINTGEEIEMPKVINLCKMHRNIPINIIALGEYYTDKKYFEFLDSLVKSTNGSFNGK
jgi:FtsZ-binding cell division protein ZapB